MAARMNFTSHRKFMSILTGFHFFSYPHMHIHIHRQTHTRHTHTHIHAHTHTCTHTDMHTYTHTDTCTHIHVIHTHAYTHTHTCTRAHTHAHMHTHTRHTLTDRSSSLYIDHLHVCHHGTTHSPPPPHHHHSHDSPLHCDVQSCTADQCGTAYTETSNGCKQEDNMTESVVYTGRHSTLVVSSTGTHGLTCMQ